MKSNTKLYLGLFIFFQIVDAAVDLVEGIAVDWVGRNIYWTDYMLEVIEVVLCV